MISKRTGSHKLGSKSHMIMQEPPNPWKEVTPLELGVKFSQPKLLVSAAYSPVTYQVTLATDKKLSFSIHTRAEHVRIKPSSGTLTRRHKKLTVELLCTQALNQEIDLVHLHEASQTFCTLKVYVLGPEGTQIRTAGNDEHYQLSHEFTCKRFAEELEAALEGVPGPSKLTNILRPTPEVVCGNIDTLTIRTDQRTCYLEYPYWVGVAMGEMHSLACTSDGRLYSWGTGIFGQLGVELDEFTNAQQEIVDVKAKKHWYPKLCTLKLERSLPENLKEALESRHKLPFIAVTPGLKQVKLASPVTMVACGLHHSVVLSDGVPYSFGLGEAGRLGHGDEESLSLPKAIPLSERCIKVACGYHSSFFIGESHHLFACGDKSQGAIGHDHHKFVPTLVPFVQHVHFVSSAHSHTAVVTFEGKAVLFGSNADNKLGGHSPHTIPAIEGQKLRGVYCGGKHTCALTEQLEVFAWGHNSSGQLGLSSTMFHSMKNPVKVEYLTGRCVVNLALGWEHSSAITVDGILYTWGSNAKGQLGIGTLAKEFKRVGLPRLVDQLLGNPVACISASKTASIFITADAHPESDSSIFHTWKNSLLVEEKHIQELSNYRFSLLFRDLKRTSLIQKVQGERDKLLGAKQRAPRQKENTKRKPPAKAEDKPVRMPEGYYSFWVEGSHAKQKGQKRVYTFNTPSYYHEKEARVVTVFDKPVRNVNPRKQSLDLRDIVTFASVQGAELEPLIPTSYQEAAEPSRPVYYERTKHTPEFTYTPSGLYPSLFSPYHLVPNPVLIAPSSRKKQH